jgi:hypothetical protein
VDLNSPNAESLYTESSVHSSSSRSSGRIISILQVQPSESQHPVIDGSTTEQIKLMEWRFNMIDSWRDRIAVIFSQQNDTFQPLPMWSEVPTQPETPLGREIWERANIMRKYWAARLNGGYIQTDIIIRDSPYDSLPGNTNLNSGDHTWDYSDDYAWFNEGYEGLAE